MDVAGFMHHLHSTNCLSLRCIHLLYWPAPVQVFSLSLSSCLSSGRQRFAFLPIHKQPGMGYLRSIAIDCDFAVVLASEQRVHRESFRLFVNANPHQTKKIRAWTTEIKYL